MEIQRGYPRAAGLRRRVEADDQRALLGAGRLVEVQQDGGVRQRRVGAGAEQRIAAVAQREPPLEHADRVRREDDGELPALAGSQRLAGGHRPQQGEIGALHEDRRHGEDQRGFVLDGDEALGGRAADHDPEIQRAGKRRPGGGIDAVSEARRHGSGQQDRDAVGIERGAVGTSIGGAERDREIDRTLRCKPDRERGRRRQLETHAGDGQHVHGGRGAGGVAQAKVSDAGLIGI